MHAAVCEGSRNLTLWKLEQLLQIPVWNIKKKNKKTTQEANSFGHAVFLQGFLQHFISFLPLKVFLIFQWQCKGLKVVWNKARTHFLWNSFFVNSYFDVLHCFPLSFNTFALNWTELFQLWPLWELKKTKKQPGLYLVQRHTLCDIA